MDQFTGIGTIRIDGGPIETGVVDRVTEVALPPPQPVAATSGTLTLLAASAVGALVALSIDLAVAGASGRGVLRSPPAVRSGGELVAGLLALAGGAFVGGIAAGRLVRGRGAAGGVLSVLWLSTAIVVARALGPRPGTVPRVLGSVRLYDWSSARGASAFLAIAGLALLPFVGRCGGVVGGSVHGGDAS